MAQEEEQASAIELVVDEKFREYLTRYVQVPASKLEVTLERLTREVGTPVSVPAAVSAVTTKFCTGLGLGSFKFNEEKWQAWIET